MGVVNCEMWDVGAYYGSHCIFIYEDKFSVFKLRNVIQKKPY